MHKNGKKRNTGNIMYFVSILVFSYDNSNQNFNILLQLSDRGPNVKPPATHKKFTTSSTQPDEHESKGKMLSFLKDTGVGGGGSLKLKATKQFCFLPPFIV